MFSFLKKWSANASEVFESDQIMKDLTGINQRGQHPSIYKNQLESFQLFEQSIMESGGERFNAAEIALYRMCYLAYIFFMSNDRRLADIYQQAISRLLKTSKDQLRKQVRLKAAEMTKRLDITEPFD